MNAFLKTRKKEFGTLVLLGMTNMQLRRMVFLENGLLGLLATITGIGLGTAFAKVILLAAENVLSLEQTLTFYWPWQAVMLTFAAFVLLFAGISFFTAAVLRGDKLIDLLKGSVMPRPEPKASIWLSLLAALCIGTGYAVALKVEGVAVAAAFIPVSVLVIIGTYFLFTQLSVRLIHFGKKRKAFFWRKTNMLFLSDMAYRMKDNARMFFLTAILSTVAFSAIGALVGFKTMMNDSILKENPFALEYISQAGNPEETERAHVEAIEETLRSEQIAYTLYKAEMKTVAGAEDGQTVVTVKQSDYNQAAEAAGESPVHLQDGQAVAIYYSNPFINRMDRQEQLSFAEQDTVLQVTDRMQTYVLPIFSTFYVIPDSVFASLQGEKLERFYAFDVADWGSTLHAGEQLREKFGKRGSGPYDYKSLAIAMHEMNQSYGVILFVGLFIGVVFFVAAGSFLYFRLYADLEDDKHKFSAIRRLGLSDEEQAKVVTRQLLLLFFVPVGTALIHGAVALTAFQRMFSFSLVMESALVLGSFLLIQLIYFLLIRARYIHQLRTE